MPVALGVSILVVLAMVLIAAFVLETIGFTLPTIAWQLLGAFIVLLAMIVWDVTF